MGFGEMSDPKFIHHLLWSEDEKHQKKTQTNDVSVQTDKCWNSDREQAKGRHYGNFIYCKKSTNLNIEK